MLNSIINKQFNAPENPTYYYYIISENRAIANGFNNYFTNVGFNLAKNISSPDQDVSIYDYLGKGCNGSMFLSLVDEQEIIRTVQQFKNKVSTDFTDINMSMVRTIITEIVKSLNHMCNVSFQTGVFSRQ